MKKEGEEKRRGFIEFDGVSANVIVVLGKRESCTLSQCLLQWQFTFVSSFDIMLALCVFGYLETTILFEKPFLFLFCLCIQDILLMPNHVYEISQSMNQCYVDTFTSNQCIFDFGHKKKKNK